MEPRPKKLLDQVCDVIRLKHYSYRTEKTYIHWIRRYILFHHKRHPQELGCLEIEQFLTHLAVDEHVCASTQNQAFSAIFSTGLSYDKNSMVQLRLCEPNGLAIYPQS